MNIYVINIARMLFFHSFESNYCDSTESGIYFRFYIYTLTNKLIANKLFEMLFF